VKNRTSWTPTGSDAASEEFFNSCSWSCGPRPGHENGRPRVSAALTGSQLGLFSDQAGALAALFTRGPVLLWQRIGFMALICVTPHKTNS
jgi:hypothetical protein